VVTKSKLQVRTASPADAPDLHAMIRELAEFERLEATVAISEAQLAEELGDGGFFEALIAELDGRTVGMATFFPTFPTFVGRRGLYLEDIFVRENHRHQGIGNALFRELGRLAMERNYARIEWSTLLWNTAAIEFYESLGAEPNHAWTMYRLSGEWIKRLADGADADTSA